MQFFNTFLSKNITVRVNKFIELFFPPILADRKIVACFFNYLQGRGFKYYDVTKNPAAYPRGKRDSDYTSSQKKTVMNLIIGKSILDIGCGNGNYLKLLAERGYKCIGIDPNYTTVNKENLQILSGFVQDFKFSEKSFDTVLSFKVIEHILEARAELVYWRTLARKRLILILPCQRYRHYVYDGHINFYPDEYQLRIQLGLSSKAVVRKVSGEWVVYEDI